MYKNKTGMYIFLYIFFYFLLYVYDIESADL